MSPHRLLHIPRHTVRIAVYVLLAGVVLYFALSHTQVGRDGLRNEIERQFAGTFQGRLEIGRLKGNLIQDLFASNVRLYDPAGRVVMEVDSLVARPSWRDLFRRRISIASLTLIRPRFYLRYQADSTWNVARVFQRRTPSQPGSRDPWTFTSADLLLIDGAVQTRHEASVPPLVQQGWLFNFAGTEAHDLQARATIEWNLDARLIDVLHFSGTAPDAGLVLDNLQGQVLWEPERIQVNQLAIQAGRTDLHLDASVAHPEALRAGSLQDVEIDGELQPSRIDFDLLRRLVPRLPLADVVSASARVQGPLNRLVVEELTAERGQTRLQAEGTVLGLPDSLDFELALHNSSLMSNDLQAVLPTVSLPDLAHLGPISVDLTARGVAHRGGPAPAPGLSAAADLELRGAPGHLAGTASFTHRPGSTPTYTLDLSTDSLDAGRLTRRDDFASALNGRLQVRGRGLSLDSLDASIRADLRSSRFAGRRVDTLHVDALVAKQRVEATAFARERGGSIRAGGVFDFSTPQPGYRLDLTTRRLDLGPMLDADSMQSSLNTRWTLAGTGASWNDFRGDLSIDIDSSAVRVGQARRIIRPHQAVLTIRAPGDVLPRLQLEGDLVRMRVDGEVPLEPLLALGTLWREAFGEAVGRQAHKPFPVAPGQPTPAALRIVSLDQISRQEEARTALQAAGLDSLAFNVLLEVKQADLLTELIPTLPYLETNLRSKLRVVADADRLHLDASFSGNTLEIDRYRTDGFQAGLRADASLNVPLEQSLTLSLDARADSLLLADQTFPKADLTARFERQQGRFTLTTDRNGRTGPVRLAAALDLLPDRNRLTLLDFHLALGDYTWTNPDQQPVDLYDRMAVVPNLLLESAATEGHAAQRLRMHGTLSAAPQDTFFVEVENIGLRQLSSFFALKRSLGGQLSGQVAFTGTAQPELTGTLAVDALALDDDVLGRLEATSRYVPGSPDVVLDLNLVPLLPTETPPAGHIRENRLHLGGTFRLPRSTATGTDDDGRLDLRLNADRIDAFFLQILFSDVRNVTGAVAGSGLIRGSFQRPLVDADFRLDDVHFAVPKFNLLYRLDGPLRIDDQAVRLNDLTLSDPTGGAAKVSGNIFFNDYRFFSFDLTGGLNELLIMDVANSRELPFYGKIWASGNATLTGPVYNTLLRSTDAVTSARSEVFIPITESDTSVDPGFIVFTDSTGRIPDVEPLIRRKNILAGRPEGERSFTQGMDMDLNIYAPAGSTVHLVIDPLLGDVINAVGSGRIQLQRQEGEFFTYGTLQADAGDYLFTAGEVFVRRFLISEGTITWDGDPLDARLDIQAAYRTRASRAGLPSDLANRLQPLIPFIVKLHITGRVSSPLVDLDLAVDLNDRENLSDAQFLETYINQSDRAPEYATSVLLTNSFLLTTENTQSDVLAGSAFNSVSQLVSSQLNRYLSQVVPNADFSFGVQGDETAQDLDLTAGLAIRLLNERLVIRGQGVYRGLRPTSDEVGAASQQALQGEFVVEIRLSSSVSVEVFYRREGDVLSESILTSTTGAGLSYNTQFATWRSLYHRIFGKGSAPEPPAVPVDSTVVDLRKEDP